MMETKFSALKRHTFLWFFSMVLFCCLAASNASAQLAPLPVQRDSSLLNYQVVTRAEVLAMDEQMALYLLSQHAFRISDLVNATYRDFIDALPGVFFMSEYEFYDLASTKQLDIIKNPDVYKVYSTQVQE